MKLMLLSCLAIAVFGCNKAQEESQVVKDLKAVSEIAQRYGVTNIAITMNGKGIVTMKSDTNQITYTPTWMFQLPHQEPDGQWRYSK